MRIFKKNFYNNKEKELPFAVRVIGANISLDRYYKNVNAESVINELISISSPIEEKKTFLVKLKRGNLADESTKDYSSVYKKN